VGAFLITIYVAISTILHYIQQKLTGTTKKKMILTEEHIELVAKEVLQWPSSRKWNSSDKDRRIRSFFGAPSNVVADLWNRIRDRGGLEDGAKPKHLLWALIFLKNYSPIEILCSIVGWPSTKTFSKWAWYFVESFVNGSVVVVVMLGRKAIVPSSCRTNHRTGGAISRSDFRISLAHSSASFK